MDYSPPSPSVQARILEWLSIPFSRGSCQPRGQNLGLLHCRQILYHLSHQGSPCLLHTQVIFAFHSVLCLSHQQVILQPRTHHGCVQEHTSHSPLGTRPLLHATLPCSERSRPLEGLLRRVLPWGSHSKMPKERIRKTPHDAIPVPRSCTQHTCAVCESKPTVPGTEHRWGEPDPTHGCMSVRVWKRAQVTPSNVVCTCAMTPTQISVILKACRDRGCSREDRKYTRFPKVNLLENQKQCKTEH